MRTTAMKNAPSRSSLIRGYTLVEFAVAVLIMGVMLSSIGAVGTQYLKAQKENTTLNNASLLAAAINNYLVQTGHYPCPAPFVPRSDAADYGVAGDCTDHTVPIGQCNHGGGAADHNYCVQVSNRNWNPSGVAPAKWNDVWPPLWAQSPPWPPTIAPGPQSTPYWNGRVRRGEVPFRTLGIPEYETLDGYGDEFQYAVTENLAVKGLYNKDLGGIDVVNANAPVAPTTADPSGYASLVTAPADSLGGGSVQYILISSGPDRKGAFTENGDLTHPVYPCAPMLVANSTPSTLDAPNCQTGVNEWSNAVYFSALYSPVTGPNHFDDLIMYYNSDKTPLWQVAGSAGTAISDLVNASDNAGQGKVGIDRNDLPTGVGTPDAAMQVGSPHPWDKAVLVEPSTPGTGDLMANELCGLGPLPGQPGSNCVQAKMSMNCNGANKVATGFSNGTMSCVDQNQINMTCPANEHMIGISNSGQIECSSQLSCPTTWTNFCWTWVQVPSLPMGQSETVSSGFAASEVWTCGGSWSGPSWSNTPQTGSCTQCNQATNNYNESCNQYHGWWPCGSCWSGNVGVTQTTTCNPTNTTYTYSNTGSCTCNPQTWNYNNTCPQGYTGNFTTTKKFTCDGANPTAAAQGPFWTSTQSTDCVCDPTATRTQTMTCQAYGLGAGYSGTVTQTSNMTCQSVNSGTWSAWTTTSNTCTCQPIKQYQQIGCPAPEQGTQYQQKTFDCTADAWGPWVTTNNTCSSLVYQWSLSNGETPSGTSGSALSNSLGSTCSTQGAVSPCSAPNGVNGYYIYSTCICQ